MDAEDLRLLRESLAHAVTDAGSGGLRAAVAGFGWHELLAEHPDAAVSTLATLQGEHLTATSLLDDVVLAAAGIKETARVVYPDLPAAEPTSRLEGGTLLVRGVAAATGDERAVVPAVRDGEPVIVTTDLTGAATADPAAGLDPGAGWALVRTESRVRPDQVLDGPEALARWRAMRAAGQRALAYELIAIGRRMLAGAVEHVGTREQFGRRLGAFQAVKHALADVRLWQECAELAAEASWEDDPVEPARLAKILAGRFVRTAAANCQQVLGGMGFTWEHEFHRYLRRGLLLEPLLGSAARLRADLGSRLRTDGVPKLSAL
ncbi:acyl-CoA dehydrogenase [Actinomadura sp. LD22]|uniref:Acyl-CoA dehydrogenase n=2 Tax=Actinomadura physcomitrii TaxID=2650748 RepID=A0A6I4MFA2_9ACTN|nr:acyl-CoA dehydrogenase [Actinomadura physcomitrii]